MKTTVGLLLLVLSVLLAGCHGEKAPAAPPAAPPRVEGDKVILPANSPQLAMLAIAVTEPRKNSTLHFTGRLAWDDNVTVRVFSPVAGRVRRVTADIGQPVAKGADLALLDSPDYGQAQADARKAASDLALKERTLARVQALFSNGAAAEKDLLSAKADQEAAVFENQRAAARLALYGGNTNAVDGLYHLTTPLGGTVVERNLNPGQEIRADQMLANAPQFFAPLFVVSNPTQLWILIDVTETDIPFVKPGQPLRVRSRTFCDKTFDGRLDILGDTLDPTTRSVKARGWIRNPDRLLKAEMYVSVELDTAAQAGVEVPAKAVFVKGDKYFVFVEEAPGCYRRHEVRTGDEYEGRIPVANGIGPGTRVVADGCLLLDAMMNSSE
jgi:membrane fusion protein, heavy metal efflux system